MSLSVVVAAALAVGTVLVGTGPAGASAVKADNPQPPSIAAADAAPDGSTLASQTEASATAQAAATNKMVSVASETTGDSITWANPDGTFTTQETASPTRIVDHSSASGWKDIDDTLVANSDGSVTPKASNVPITLSGAASAGTVAQNGVVAVADGNGSPVKFGWSGALPTPELDGDTATYVGVEPNLNIVVKMTATGFEQNFVLTGPPTANELNLVLPLSTPGLTTKALQGGSISLTNAASNVVGTIQPAFMWDSRTDPETGLPTDEVQLAVSANSQSLSISSPASFFADPKVQYPVTIDPTYSVYIPGDTYVRSDFPTTTYQSYDPTELEVGTYNGGASVARAFMNFGGGSYWRNTIITGATLTLYEFHAYNCTASSIYAQYAGIESAATDWNNQPGRSSSYEGHATVALGGGTGCPAGSFGINIAPIIIHDAPSGSGTFGMALVAGSESSDDGWKRMYSADESTVSVRPKLTITYEHTPDIPPAPVLSAPQRACGTSTDPAYVNGTQDLGFETSVSDADSGVPMANVYQVYDATLSGATLTATTTQATSPVTSATITSGSITGTVPANSLAPGYYAVEAQTVVPSYISQVPASSGWSAPCFFVVKDSAPGLPSVTTTMTPTDVGGEMQVDVSASAADGPAVFAYWWSDSYQTGEGQAVPADGTAVSIATALPSDGTGSESVRFAAVPAPALDATTISTTLTVDPPDTNATLWVAEYDAAGNVSTDPAVTTNHSTGAPLRNLASDPNVSLTYGHEWYVSDGPTPIGTTVADKNTSGVGSATTNESDLTLGSSSPQSTTAMTDGFSVAPVFSFDGTTASDTISSSQQVVDTTQAYTVGAFLAPTSVTSGLEETALSESNTGSTDAAFVLGLSAGGRFEFCVRPQVTPGAEVCAVDPNTAGTAGTFVQGVWDPLNEQIRLYEAGSVDAIATAWYSPLGGEVSANGPLLVGADWVGGSYSSEWSGDISDPSIFPGIENDQQALNLSGPGDVN